MSLSVATLLILLNLYGTSTTAAVTAVPNFTTQCNDSSCYPSTPASVSRSMPLTFHDIIPPDYDKMQAPKMNGMPVEVDIKISILNIRSVNEDTLSYEIDVFFHQHWRDSRLTLPSDHPEEKVVLDNKWRDNIWTPDTYFKNALTGHLNNIVHPYMYIVLKRDGTMFLAARVSLKLSCNMDLVKYPHDEQDCKVVIMSLHHTTEAVILRWKEFEITKNLYLSQFYVSDSSNGTKISKYAIGSFSSLYGRVRLSRRVGYYLINNYIPCILIVTMSFVSFWIPVQAYPARVTLCVTSLLTIVTQQYKSSGISVSYIVALNIWMMGCIAFVFLSLLEYALAITIADITHMRREKYKGEQQNKADNVVADNGTAVPIDGPNEKSPPKTPKKKIEAPPISISHTLIDRCSRVLFPFAFVLFCLTYFLVFCL